MGRRYYNLVTKVIFSLFIVCAFCRCTPTPPQFEEMIGVWKAKDGSIIELKSDSTFKIKNFNSYFLIKPHDTIETKLHIEGEWNIWVDNKQGHFMLSLNIKHCVRSNDSLSISDEKESILRYTGRNLYIKGEQGILNNQPPWFIRAIDNFDDYTTYDFHRVK